MGGSPLPSPDGSEIGSNEEPQQATDSHGRSSYRERPHKSLIGSLRFLHDLDDTLLGDAAGIQKRLQQRKMCPKQLVNSASNKSPMLG